MTFLYTFLAVTVSFALTQFIVPGITLLTSNDWGSRLAVFLIAGFILALLETFLKPALKLALIPIMILSLGLGYFIIPIAFLWLVDVLMVQVNFQGFTTFLIAGPIYAVLLFLIRRLEPSK